jgi:hypothetical protein
MVDSPQPVRALQSFRLPENSMRSEEALAQQSLQSDKVPYYLVTGLLASCSLTLIGYPGLPFQLSLRLSFQTTKPIT